MNETQYKPRKKWWGFTFEGYRFLCRYNHIFCVFSQKELMYANYETRTDKQVGIICNRIF